MTMPSIKPSQADAPATLSAADQLAPIATAVLRGVAKGLAGGFQVGELWLLDDESRNLRLAARWSDRDCAPTTRRRQLATAPADVAALAGGAIVLETQAEMAGWGLHAPAAGAAIGLPVASEATIHGVMWLLDERPRTIADEAVELAEVVAGRLALEVERSIDGGRGAATVRERSASLYPELADTQSKSSTAAMTSRLPASPSVLPVETAHWTAPHTEGLAAANVWELANDRLLAMAIAAIDSPDSSTATQRAAVEWLIGEAPQLAEKAGDAGILLTLLNRRLQTSPLAGEGLAVAAALVEAPEDAAAGLGGTGTWAFAGPSIVISVRASATKTHAGDLVPLGWTEPECAYAPRPFELAIRQRLVLTAGDPRLTSPLAERRLGDIYRAAPSDAHREMSPENCLRRLAAGIRADDVLSAVALRRA